MRNKAKCKLCLTIIESFHPTDLVNCKCGEIFVDGGSAMKCGASNWNNFLRVDDEGNEIQIKLKNDDQVKPLYNEKISTKKELISRIEDVIASIESLPNHAMSSPLTHWDYINLLQLIKDIFKAE